MNMCFFKSSGDAHVPNLFFWFHTHRVHVWYVHLPKSTFGEGIFTIGSYGLVNDKEMNNQMGVERR